MTNNIVAFDFNGVKVLKDSNTKLKRLTIPGSTVTDLSFHDSESNDDYQVPTGKKLTIIYIETFQVTAPGGAKIIYADDADGTTNAVSLFDPNTASSLTDFIFISPEIPADKYVNIDHSGGSVSATIIWGVEEDA